MPKNIFNVADDRNKQLIHKSGKVKRIVTWITLLSIRVKKILTQ